MPDIVEHLPRILLEAADEQMRADGSSPRPQVHFLAEDMDVSYLGYIVCRRFYRGADAAEALADLGVVPSLVKATRLFLLWDDHDLRTALEIQGEKPVPGLVIVDARLTGHTLHWHPFTARIEPARRRNAHTIVVTWNKPARYSDVPLPAPIENLLEIWRELRDDDLRSTAIRLEKAGYEFNWAAPRNR